MPRNTVPRNTVPCPPRHATPHRQVAYACGTHMTHAAHTHGARMHKCGAYTHACGRALMWACTHTGMQSRGHALTWCRRLSVETLNRKAVGNGHSLVHARLEAGCTAHARLEAAQALGGKSVGAGTACIPACARAGTHACAYAHLRALAHALARADACVHALQYTNTRAHARKHTRTCISACTHAHKHKNQRQHTSMKARTSMACTLTHIEPPLATKVPSPKP